MAAGGDERAALGARLRRQRESRSLSVPDVSKVTKIPEKSVLLLEAGSFDDLPGDVFVRGFIRSYCKSVGLDADTTLRDYGELIERSPRARREPSLTRPGVRGSAETEAHAFVAPVPAPAAAPAAAARSGEAAVAAPAQPEVPDEMSLFSALRGAGHGGSRLPLTLAVIILVIVATLTLSLLLRRPNHGGSGVSFREKPTSLA